MTTEQIKKLRIPIPGAAKSNRSDKKNAERQKEKMEALANRFVELTCDRQLTN